MTRFLGFVQNIDICSPSSPPSPTEDRSMTDLPVTRAPKPAHRRGTLAPGMGTDS